MKREKLLKMKKYGNTEWWRAKVEEKQWKGTGGCARNRDVKGRAGAAGGKPQEGKGGERGRLGCSGTGRDQVCGAGIPDGPPLAESEGSGLRCLPPGAAEGREPRARSRPVRPPEAPLP